MLSFIIYSVQFSFAHESFHLYEISECILLLEKKVRVKSGIESQESQVNDHQRKSEIIAQVIVRQSLDIASSFNLD